MLRVVIWQFFGDLSQSEKLSEIKPPLDDSDLFVTKTSELSLEQAVAFETSMASLR